MDRQMVTKIYMGIKVDTQINPQIDRQIDKESQIDRWTDGKVINKN